MYVFHFPLYDFTIGHIFSFFPGGDSANKGFSAEFLLASPAKGGIYGFLHSKHRRFSGGPALSGEAGEPTLLPVCIWSGKVPD